MVTKHTNPPLPSASVPKPASSYPPTSKELSVPVGGASPKTDGPGARAARESIQSNPAPEAHFTDITPQHAHAASRAMGPGKGGAAALPRKPAGSGGSTSPQPSLPDRMTHADIKAAGRRFGGW
jgi:hypothetical protein